MKILIHGINFAPELTGTGKYSGEMAAWLAAAGHEVRVVTASPYYPEWRIAAGFANTWQTERWQGVGVWRCPLYVPARPSGSKRLLHLVSFALSSLPVMLRHTAWRPDVVWVVEPAFMCAPGAWFTARLSGAKLWLHVQDFEVDAAFDLGLIKGERLKRWALAVERFIKQRFDVVSSISGRMIERLLTKGLPLHKTQLAPNWVDISAISPRSPAEGPSPYRSQLGLSDTAVVALYSGNMGNKQGLEVLAETARRLLATHAPGTPASVEFVFCGNGAGRPALEAACEGLPNVRFLDLQPIERLNNLLALADIHLLPQKADAADLVMPSKLTGMLASGRAVLATALPATELGRVVAQDAACGLVVPPEDPVALAEALRTLADNAARRSVLGTNGRRYAERVLDRDEILHRFEAQLLALVRGGTA